MIKIGKLAKQAAPAIFAYCETTDPAEFARLQERIYSKETFGINYPFCLPASRIGATQHKRFWRDIYHVHGIAVRVTSQWYNPPTSKSLGLLQTYLRDRAIDIGDIAGADFHSTLTSLPDKATPSARGRYRGNAIGNVQNLLVRNILSNLGDESFTAEDWQRVIGEFANTCAYCGAGGKLVMDHVIAINRQALGEHRLGNLVPACQKCNADKASQDYRSFLAHDPARLAAIEAHMAKYGYTPIGEDEMLRQTIEAAHLEVRQTAARYVKLINSLSRISQPARSAPPEKP